MRRESYTLMKQLHVGFMVLSDNHPYILISISPQGSFSVRCRIRLHTDCPGRASIGVMELALLVFSRRTDSPLPML